MQIKKRATASPTRRKHTTHAAHSAEAIHALDAALRRLMWLERGWLKDALREDKLEIAPFIVLGHLRHCGEATTIGALAKHLDQHNTTMTGHIDRLEQKGFVTRKFGGAADRRQVVVQLTPEGKTFLERINTSRHEHIRQMCAHISARGVQQFVAMLEEYLGPAENEK